MNRLFSIRRRRPHYVDFWTPRVAGVDGYRLKWAANFDGAPATFITSTNVGFIDDNVNRAVVDTQPLNGQVRVVFDPTTYTIPDDVSFWLQFVPVTGGVEGTPGAMTLVLPSSANHGVGLVIISGTTSGLQQLDLPLLQDFRISAAGDVDIATEAGGALFTVQGSTDVSALGLLGTQGTLYIDGGPFSLSATLAFPR